MPTDFNKLHRPEAKWSILSKPIKSGVPAKENSTKQITCLLRNWDGNITRYWHANSSSSSTWKRKRSHRDVRALWWHMWGMICSVCLIGFRSDRWELKRKKRGKWRDEGFSGARGQITVVEIGMVEMKVNILLREPYSYWIQKST